MGRLITLHQMAGIMYDNLLVLYRRFFPCSGQRFFSLFFLESPVPWIQIFPTSFCAMLARSGPRGLMANERFHYLSLVYVWSVCSTCTDLCGHHDQLYTARWINPFERPEGGGGGKSFFSPSTLRTQLHTEIMIK